MIHLNSDIECGSTFTAIPFSKVSQVSVAFRGSSKGGAITLFDIKNAEKSVRFELPKSEPVDTEDGDTATVDTEDGGETETETTNVENIDIEDLVFRIHDFTLDGSWESVALRADFEEGNLHVGSVVIHA